ncbi:MAG: hypothetical protein ACO3VO_10705 [Ilumatobacteraceae bacterium]
MAVADFTARLAALQSAGSATVDALLTDVRCDIARIEAEIEADRTEQVECNDS